MISIYRIKPAFQKLLLPVLRALHKMGVTANQITTASILLSLLIGIAFWFGEYNSLLFLALPIGLFLRMALNAMDGMMARHYDQGSKKGEVLNETGDIVSDLFVFFPLLLYEKEAILMVVAFISLSILNEFVGLLAKVVSGERRYDGPMGKSDRAFVLGVYGILAFLGLGFGAYSPWIFGLVNLLLLLSTGIRIHHSINKL